jgi:hypothetical protein
LMKFRILFELLQLFSQIALVVIYIKRQISHRLFLSSHGLKRYIVVLFDLIIRLENTDFTFVNLDERIEFCLEKLERIHFF